MLTVGVANLRATTHISKCRRTGTGVSHAQIYNGSWMKRLTSYDAALLVSALP